MKSTLKPSFRPSGQKQAHRSSFFRENGPQKTGFPSFHLRFLWLTFKNQILSKIARLSFERDSKTV